MIIDRNNLIAIFRKFCYGKTNENNEKLYYNFYPNFFPNNLLMEYKVDINTFFNYFDDSYLIYNKDLINYILNSIIIETFNSTLSEIPVKDLFDVIINIGLYILHIIILTKHFGVEYSKIDHLHFMILLRKINSAQFMNNPKVEKCPVVSYYSIKN